MIQREGCWIPQALGPNTPGVKENLHPSSRFSLGSSGRDVDWGSVPIISRRAVMKHPVTLQSRQTEPMRGHPSRSCLQKRPVSARDQESGWSGKVVQKMSPSRGYGEHSAKKDWPDKSTRIPLICDRHSHYAPRFF